MRVLVISHSAIQPTYHRKFEELSKYDDIQLRIIVPDSWVENNQLLTFSGKQVSQNLSFYSEKVIFPSYGSRFLFRRGIIKHFRKFKPDIIHLEEEPWSLCALQTMILRRLLCPQSRLIFRTSLSIPMKLKFNFIGPVIEKKTFKECDYAFILSEKAGEILREKGYQKEMKVSPNGVDTKMFKKTDVTNLKQELGMDKGKFIIGYLGRLMKMKGLATLLEAFSILYQDSGKESSIPHLLIIGSGDYKDEMLSLATRLDIKQNITLIDAIPAEDVPGYINCMDVLVLPSITTPGWVEFFGRVLVEAMVCEVPVIGSSSGEIPNVIGDAGLVFQENDEMDLKDKIAILMKNPNLRISLAQKGYARANLLFTWESIAKDTYEVYQNILG